MPEPTYTESFIRLHATPKSFERGAEYYYDGYVLSMEQRGDELVGQVEGSQYEAYQVRITFTGDTVESAFCDCPYDWGGWCKHVVAVLMAALHEPETVKERPTLGSLLDDLDHEQLQTLIRYLAARRPDLVADVEAWLALTMAGEDTGTSPVSVNPGPIRRRVHAALHSLDDMRRSEAYWHVSRVVDEVRRVLDEVKTFIGQGDGKNALVLLNALTGEYVKEWTWLDDSDGFVHAFFYDLGPVWTEALLSARLTPAEREQWAEQLDQWQDELSDYGIEDVFWTARSAVEEEWEDEDVLTDDELINARLNILARRQEYDDFLRLAEKAGHYRRYTVMLAQLGRFKEAVDAGRKLFSTAEEALALTLALHQNGDAQAALNVAEHGLTLDGRYEKVELALWLRDHAERMGRADLALKAALVGVKMLPDLDAYLKVQELAGDQWPKYQEELLEQYTRTDWFTSPGGTIDIFLHEGLIDAAIAAVQGSHVGFDTIKKVADAAIDTRPEWAIATAREQAEQIMDEGRSQLYHHAADWLARARDAYRSAEREDEWLAYLADLQDKHRRKYKLMPMLTRL